MSVPVTVKMRLGWDDESLTAPALARAFEQVGVAAVIVHGRTRQQGFTGSVNRAGIRAVVEAVERIPIVANGDIRTIADAAATFEETGCAAVSIGRGALANPFIFRQLDCWARTGEPGPEPAFDERLELMRRHFHGLVARRGEHYGCLQFRKILKWYSHFTRMPKPFYRGLLNLSSVRPFDEVVDGRSDRRTGIAAAGAPRVPRAGSLGGDRQVVRRRKEMNVFFCFSRGQRR